MPTPGSPESPVRFHDRCRQDRPHRLPSAGQTISSRPPAGRPISSGFVRPRREFRIRRDDAEPLLIGEDLLARGIPAHVEFALELGDPLGRRVVRRVRAAGRVVEKEGLLRRERIELIHVVDGLVCHRRGQIPARLADVGMDRRGVANEIARLPLAGFATHEAVEIIEAHADRPLIKRTGLAGLERRRVVVLAKPRGRVAIVLEDRADGRLVLGDDAVVAGIPVEISVMTPKPTEWWLRPVIKAARVGEHSAVEWNCV